MSKMIPYIWFFGFESMFKSLEGGELILLKALWL